MRTMLLALFAVLLLPSLCLSAGFVHNDNFVVFTERGVSVQATQEFAESVLAQAERYRREIAQEWLGKPLPSGVGRTTINVTFSQDRDKGITWVVDHPNRKFHTVYLNTSPDHAVGDTLAHEMAHVVLATRFPHPRRLPAWLEEGIASRYDGPDRRNRRAEVLGFMQSSGKWPMLGSMLNARNISASDAEAYVAATTLTEMLLERGGKSKLLTFGQAATRDGWSRAMAEHYGIDASQLQDTWRKWLAGSHRAAVTQQLTQFAPR